MRTIVRNAQRYVARYQWPSCHIKGHTAVAHAALLPTPHTNHNDRTFCRIAVRWPSPETRSVDRAPAFGEALQRYRRARGFTQAELAEHAQISVRAVSDLERGLKHPQRATIRLLTEALGLLPDEARDFEVVARSRPARGGTSDESAGQNTNLPVRHRRLIGRAHDVAGVCQVLRSEDSSLVTVVGPGGVGKTRLALEVANR